MHVHLSDANKDYLLVPTDASTLNYSEGVKFF